MTVTAAAFARLCGVSKVAVSKAPPNKIHKEPDGSIDTDNPINAVYLATHTGAKTPAPKTQKTRPVAKPDPEAQALTKAVLTAQSKRQAKKLEPEDDLSPQEKREQAKLKKTLDNLMGETIDLDKKKKLVDIALKTILEKNHAFKLAKAKGEVIDRAEFRRVAETWNASLGQNVMRVPRRVMSRLWAMAKAGDDARDGELMLERELSKAVGRALEGVAKGHA